MKVNEIVERIHGQDFQCAFCGGWQNDFVRALVDVLAAANTLADMHRGIEGGYLFKLKEAIAKVEALE